MQVASSSEVPWLSKYCLCFVRSGNGAVSTNFIKSKRGSSGFNDIPNMLEWFEFDAQIGLISPRPCIIIAGTKDQVVS